MAVCVIVSFYNGLRECDVFCMELSINAVFTTKSHRQQSSVIAALLAVLLYLLNRRGSVGRYYSSAHTTAQIVAQVTGIAPLHHVAILQLIA